MKRTRNAVRNVIFGGLLKGYQILVPFIMRTLLIRYLGMEYLGPGLNTGRAVPPDSNLWR